MTRITAVFGALTFARDGSAPRTPRKAPSASADTKKRYHVSVYGSRCRDAMRSVIGRTLHATTVMSDSQIPRVVCGAPFGMGIIVTGAAMAYALGHENPDPGDGRRHVRRP